MSGRRERRRRRNGGAAKSAGAAARPPAAARAPRRGPVPPASGRRPPDRAPGRAGSAPDYDVPALVRGASSGFTVLVLGELLLPLVGALSATLAGLWLSLVGAAGFAVAGRRVGRARRPMLHGAAAALGALTLTLPLRVIVDSPLPGYAFLVGAVFAVGVGAMAGRGAAALRDRRAAEHRPG